MGRIIIYGSYGYTGRLIVDAMRAQDICLAGRNESRLKEQSEETGFPYEVVDLADKEKIDALLSRATAVVHCAGPFIHTAVPMVEACLRTGTHYLDITGEYRVFEAIRKYDEQARKKHIMLMPGAGFDVVPSDCLANYLSSRMENPKNLVLAFTSSGGGMSRGTSKTMIEGMGDGHVKREKGELTSYGLGKDVKDINYGPFSRTSVGFSWGDISTAFFSTGIPDITVYTAAKPSQISRLRRIWRLRALITAPIVRNWLKKQADRKPPGPGEDQLENGESYLYGKVSGEAGDFLEARLTTHNGYKLTSMCVEYICRQILDENFKTGYQTPASAYGWQLITKITGHKITQS